MNLSVTLINRNMLGMDKGLIGIWLPPGRVYDPAYSGAFSDPTLPVSYSNRFCMIVDWGRLCSHPIAMSHLVQQCKLRRQEALQ